VRHLDGGGRLAVPTLVDSHIHPDKTGWGEPWQSRRPASNIDELVAADVDFARALPTPIRKRTLRLMSHAVAQGSRAMRAHADVAPAYGLAGVEALMSAREKLRGVLDVQIVGFPQHGVARTAGTARLLEAAAADGLIDFVGGNDPAGFDHPRDGRDQLDIIFGIAEKHGVGLDIHLHDVGDQGLGPLHAIIARTKAGGLQGKVTVSHAFAIPQLSEAELDTTADRLAEADIALTTAAYSWSTVLPYQRLIERGVRVGLGSDGVRDSWSPFGNADMLHRTWLLGWAKDMRTDDDLESAFRLACDGGATVMGLPAANLEPGSPADFMLVDGENVPQIVVDVPPRSVVFRAGRVVARNGQLV
jgi:cytosine deaminase